MDWLEEAANKAAESQPMHTGPTLRPVVPGRVLLVDGDYLAYFCAGNDEREPGIARLNAINRLEDMRDAAGCEKIVVHLTSSGSTKGDRYIIATEKAYQAQRVGSRRPKNWAYLREWMESYSGALFTTKTWGTREADDGLAYHATVLGVDKAVISTADKDLRMVPAWHLSWSAWTMTRLDTEFEVVGDDGKIYGTKWLWLQVLQGDGADNIPGLPFYANEKGAHKRMGEKTAEKFLANCKTDDEAAYIVAGLYHSYYGDDWPDRLAEQLGLLWMRRDKDATVDDWCGWFFYERNNPIHSKMFQAAQRLATRVQAAKDEVAQICT